MKQCFRDGLRFFLLCDKNGKMAMAYILGQDLLLSEAAERKTL